MDITKKEDMISYLKDNGIISDAEPYSINYCSGGVSCPVALIETGGRTLLIKQGRARLAVKEEWLADPARTNLEGKGAAYYHKYLPETQPDVLINDEENHIFVREAIPAGCHMWKADLMEGILDFKVARRTMEVMATVHSCSAKDPDVPHVFNNYNNIYELRVSPYIQFVAKKYPQLAKVSDEVSDLIMNTHQVLVHGDYSPKNIIVTPEREVCVVDSEPVHCGNAICDVSNFTTHIVLKSAYLRKYSAAFLNMLVDMTDTYFSSIDFADPKVVEANCMKALGMIVLARIDGKSPAEYITDEETKDLVRKMSFALIESDITTYRQAAELFYGLESK